MAVVEDVVASVVSSAARRCGASVLRGVALLCVDARYATRGQLEPVRQNKSASLAGQDRAGKVAGACSVCNECRNEGGLPWIPGGQSCTNDAGTLSHCFSREAAGSGDVLFRRASRPRCCSPLNGWWMGGVAGDGQKRANGQTGHSVGDGSARARLTGRKRRVA